MKCTAGKTRNTLEKVADGTFQMTLDRQLRGIEMDILEIPSIVKRNKPSAVPDSKLVTKQLTWPTPRKIDGIDPKGRLQRRDPMSNSNTVAAKVRNVQEGKGQKSSGSEAALFSTPRASDGLRSGMSMDTHYKTSQRSDGGFRTLHVDIAKITKESGNEPSEVWDVNPTWVEWLMGWPISWTKLTAIEPDWRNWECDPAELNSLHPLFIPRVVLECVENPDRLKALGNGQVPAVVAIAWEVLSARLPIEVAV